MPAAAALAGPQYLVTPELTALNGTHAVALSINAAGKVAGFGLPVGASAQNAFFETVGSSALNIGTLGGTNSIALDINNSDLLVGSSYVAGDAASHAFVSQSGGAPQDLGVFPGGNSSRALAINDAGQVIGAGTTAALTEHGFLWQPGGGFKDIGTLGGANSVANDINAAGQITGYSELAGSKAQHAFLYQSGTLTDLKTLGGSFSEGNAINASGVVVGHSTLLGDTAEHAFVAKPGAALLDLGTLGGTYSEAFAINTDGDVVGSSTNRADAAVRAVIWKNGIPTDLNTLILTGSPWTLIAARSIGDSGDIVGYGDHTDPVTLTVQRHAFLLTRDKVAPTITCPANVTTAGTQPASIGQATAVDNLDPAPVITNNKPAIFPAGDTTVIWTVTDAAGNASTCTQLVTLPNPDTTPPNVSAVWTPAQPDGLNGWYKTQPVALAWSIFDAESAITLRTGCLATTVTADTTGTASFTCSATSGGGVSPLVSTSIKLDATAPVVTAPPAASATLNGSTTTPVSFAAPTATDATSGVNAASATCTPVSGSAFKRGATPVTCSVADNAGNPGSASFNVTVTDPTSSVVTPVITPRAGNPAGLNGWHRGPVALSWTVSDLESPEALTKTGCAGLNLIADTAGTSDTCSATSAGNNGVATTQSQTLKIDATAPAVTAPPAASATLNGSTTTPVSFAAPTATDATSGVNAASAACTPVSGSAFKRGATPVTCSVADNAGNAGSASFNVTVTDPTSPVVTPVITPRAGNPAGLNGWHRGPVALSWTVSEPESPEALTKTGCAGLNLIADTAGTSDTCSATSAGNNGVATTQSQTLKIDATAPVVTAPAAMTVEATGATGAAVTYAAPGVTETGSGLNGAPACTPAAGSTFAIGTRAVACSASDLAGNTGSASFNVTVSDTTPPALTLPANMFRSTTNNSMAVTYTATANDLVSGARTVSCTPASGSLFAQGTTTVNCSAADLAANVGSGSFTVTVTRPDTTPPVLSLPANITTTATGATSATVTFTATATDAVSGVRPVTCTPASGSLFPIARTTVNCSATDAAGNTANGSFTVTVNPLPDTTAPVLTLPANITTTATGSTGATVTFTATATDAVDGVRPVTCTPASGSLFPIARTTVNCSATDAAGNTANGSFTVTVNPLPDTTAPVLSLPANITTTATGATGALVTYTATATDAVSGVRPVTCTPASGSQFPVALTTVNCSATDAAGNTANGNFTVTVNPLPDTTPPVLTLPANITTTATSATGAPVTYTATATDAVSGVRPVTCTPASGSLFPIARTTVNCSATDAAGNTANGSFTVTVNPLPDTTAPVLSLPANITTTATGATGALVTYTATATDAVSGVRPVTCTPASGSQFPVALTTVNCSATDAAGNTANGSFTVTVNPSAAADIRVTGTVSNSTPLSGTNFTYVYTVTNIGTAPAQGVSFIDVLPTALRFNSLATTPTLTCVRPNNKGGGTVSCTVGTLAAGASATLTISVRVGTAGAIANTGSATTTSTETSTANNAATLNITAQ
jgi:uncharacterized repeat protein (TIGR01451 family)